MGSSQLWRVGPVIHALWGAYCAIRPGLSACLVIVWSMQSAAQLPVGLNTAHYWKKKASTSSPTDMWTCIVTCGSLIKEVLWVNQHIIRDNNGIAKKMVVK